MTNRNISTGNEQKNVKASEETRASERFIRPSVNIIETEAGLTLTADIPGVAKETLDVHVEKGILTISGQISHSMPGQPVYTEYELAPYYRQFSIPEELDYQNAKTDFSYGVLTLHFPKAEAAKPHKIEIKVA